MNTMNIRLECPFCNRIIKQIANSENNVTMTIGVFDEYVCDRCERVDRLILRVVVSTDNPEGQPQFVEAQKGYNQHGKPNTAYRCPTAITDIPTGQSEPHSARYEYHDCIRTDNGYQSTD